MKIALNKYNCARARARFSFLTVWHWLDRDPLSRKKAFEPLIYNAEDCEPAGIENNLHAHDKQDVLSIVN